MNFQQNYLSNIQFEFQRYKTLGDKTFEQLSERDICWQYQESDNSIAIIVKHLVGNMLSRWTNFLTEDGEKTWREREMEFEGPYSSKAEMLSEWEKGWQCLFDALEEVNTSNFDAKIKIRDEEHTIIEALNRQLAHYASHVGQIVFLGKMIRGKEWISLSIPKGGSEAFNKKMFGKDKT
ncbi:DUF1572 domain-containing protein [Muricauda sp. JGD-17]|uniref:DUF1572 domain-containing protein n=1 Tax=Flagellimonas ochracea TaxID=2696472 RepID=A0A964TE66_9FLAO|nr:DUF1572 family protein [Allomuricauda ochracea]NAY93200.1 DUF1572 domain-containing protein [Allomuricauda ochracea]